ncbi:MULTISPECIES: MauE/DoxX family redox-associated membrane protein [unclassified Actinomyces]|uniref:MauE/DoxX family redox-associated membrane protein n=1 Tax=unclassified Actinomyces TaxID=2609248 RepID=UPI0020176E93|nr:MULTISPECIES: MauE/DoxX family redox-associated membrane protein [unclassified Actinomyces]MCL3777391.1 hypothetical protein [Actinomyces sp. AC-20-1]MCL3789087.1 hypothetical protein [Actinomyces sp. 187325]MCL3791661.1 hypothetical protein [Actinomyces sp. 186855]MCL3793889.1 hypothetical protein [Actinomyces sp. 217892]
MDTLALILAGARLLAGLLLFVSATGKLRQDYRQGVSDILGYRILGARTAEATAFALPVVEMTLSMCLILGMFAPLISVLTSVLFVLLTAAAASVLARGIATDCGCWGSIARRRVGPAVVIRNVVLAALLAVDGLVVVPQRLVLAGPVSSVYLGLAVVVALLVLQRWFQYRGSQPQPIAHAAPQPLPPASSQQPSAEPCACSPGRTPS